MDVNQLLEIEKRSEAATRGPWQVHRSLLGERQIGTLWDHPQIKGPLAIVTMSLHAVEPKHRVFIKEDDAEFIAHSRQDIQELVEEVKRLRAALYYIGHYNRGTKEETAHVPNTEKFHLQEVARENLECDVDYTNHLPSDFLTK
jgi:hypothetical protein